MRFLNSFLSIFLFTALIIPAVAKAAGGADGEVCGYVKNNGWTPEDVVEVCSDGATRKHGEYGTEICVCRTWQPLSYSIQGTICGQKRTSELYSYLWHSGYWSEWVKDPNGGNSDVLYQCCQPLVTFESESKLFKVSDNAYYETLKQKKYQVVNFTKRPETISVPPNVDKRSPTFYCQRQQQQQSQQQAQQQQQQQQQQQ